MTRKFWEMRNATETTGEILLYGPIAPDDGMGWLFDEITPKSFKDDLDGLGNVSDLRVMINSGGGDVFAGQAIHSMLVRHNAKVTVYVDGLAASVAAVVAMAGDEVIMPRNAMMMVHNPFTFGMGDAEEFRQIARTLDQIRESIVAAYQDKTGMKREDLVGLLDAETWMTAEEAVELGFADTVESSRKIVASLVTPDRLVCNGQETDLGRFKNRPKVAHDPLAVMPFDEHRSQAIELAERLGERWAEIANKSTNLSEGRRERLNADASALERVVSTLNGLLPDAAGERDEVVERLLVDFEALKACMNGVAV